MSDFNPTAEQIDAVHEWHQRRPEDRIRRALVPELQSRFQITAVQAVVIIRAANGGADARASS